MWAFDRNLHQIHWASRSRVIHWNTQSYASVGASGPRHLFCLAIPMWQSKWISMTILFLKRHRVAHFYWWISIRTWQKVLWNWLRPPLPLDLQVSVSLLCMNVGTVTVHISRNHFISPSGAVLVRASEGMHPGDEKVWRDDDNSHKSPILLCYEAKLLILIFSSIYQ